MADKEIFTALAEVRAVLEDAARRIPDVVARTEELQLGRARGASFGDLINGAQGPLVLDALSELLQGLFTAGSRLRRAEARALYAEGLSMDKIGRLLGVSRQRVSAILNSQNAPRADALSPDDA
jgi:hypothetical protein